MYNGEKARSLSDILNSEKAFDKVKKVAEEYRAVNEFHIVFPELKKVAAAVKIKNKTLFLRVENSVWRSELNFRQDILTKKMNRHLNGDIVKNIKFLA